MYFLAKPTLLVDPHEEGFGVVVEDATTSWPVSASVGSLQETVTFLEEEVIIDELLLGGLVHASQRIVGALVVTLEGVQLSLHLLLHLLVLLWCHENVKQVSHL